VGRGFGKDCGWLKGPGVLCGICRMG
jgi:hypothetical protein